MAIRYLKKAIKSPQTGEDETRARVTEMLKEIEQGGEAVARAYGESLDGYAGEIEVSRAAIEAAAGRIPARLKDDIAFARERVRKFAECQKASLGAFETEIEPGVLLGQRLIPIETAGCYVPGGRYAHVASAIMSITTAKVAGVANVIACSAPHGAAGINPGILYAMDYCGADRILALGGVQGIAALAFGLFTGHPASMLIGPGNRFVAEAKRMLFGRVGIDLFAGPTEIAIIADGNADPAIVAADLVGQSEHGPDSPAWLVTTSQPLAEDVMDRVPGLIVALPEVQRRNAEAAWRDYGEVVVAGTDEEAAQVSDQWAPEHLELLTGRNDWYVGRLRSYGSLFIGEETTVAYGDKAQGTNHILPTKAAARYTGGLSVHKLIKVVTTQRMTREASRAVAAATARISRLEGMEAHARTADARLAKYFPGERFDLDARDP
ncbi:MAG: histidinol dehydrogenase [Hyphomicrobiaceae bacterium]|nr:histidinol dehydrogenase [Hyphomicrobiaceae bacterium]